MNRPAQILLFGWAAAAVCSGAEVRVASVVRADAQSGRLVRHARTTVVAPRVIAPRQVAPAAPQPASASRAEGLDIHTMIESSARRHGVDPLLVRSVIQVESGFNPYAVSPKGAQGLMQLIPATARRFGAANSFDAQSNIEAGVKYLKQLTERFPDLRLALAAYNAGEGAVERYRNIPPYRETEEYVYRVGKTYGQARKAAQSAAPPAAAPAEPPSRPLEVSVDGEGRIHLRTR